AASLDGGRARVGAGGEPVRRRAAATDRTRIRSSALLAATTSRTAAVPLSTSAAELRARAVRVGALPAVRIALRHVLRVSARDLAAAAARTRRLRAPAGAVGVRADSARAADGGCAAATGRAHSPRVVRTFGTHAVARSKHRGRQDGARWRRPRVA